MPLMKALLLASLATTAPVETGPATTTAATTATTTTTTATTATTTTMTTTATVDPEAGTLCGIFPGVVPAFENGRAIGFKLSGVARRPAAQARGLEAGDVVVRVNGFVIDRPEAGLEAFRSITRCAEMRLTVKRHGKIVELLPSMRASDGH